MQAPEVRSRGKGEGAMFGVITVENFQELTKDENFRLKAHTKINGNKSIS